MANDENQPRKMDTGLTRREWLLKLGEAAVILAMVGPAGSEAATQTGGRPPQPQGAVNNLPPGLYQPSPDHLTHALAQNARFVDVPSGSETQYAEPQAGAYHPLFFTSDEYQLARQLVERMLDPSNSAAQSVSHLGPVDDSIAGDIAQWIDRTLDNETRAREAEQKLSEQHRTLAIHYFGQDVVSRREAADPQKVWREGLGWLREASNRQYGKRFLDLDSSPQTSLLESISDHQPQKQPENAGTRLFPLLKRQVIQGYYTSKQGLKELDYRGNFFYAESPGCPKGGRA